MDSPPGEEGGLTLPTEGDSGPIFSRGETIDRYVVLGLRDVGGMGMVYAAYDPELSRTVALKVLRPDKDTSKHGRVRQARLAREARAMARLNHPNVVTVHDVGIAHGRVFVAMEFIKGRTLGRWLRRCQPRWQDILDVFVRAGRGLAAAHAAGLVHRDFKPDNILIGDDGRVRVTDFGIAREATGNSETLEIDFDKDASNAAASSPLLTKSGVILGTPAYMAPEQAEGLQADQRSDQYSFCVAAYEALYGVRPKDATLRQSSARSKSSAPDWLRVVLTRGLEPEPRQRWVTMETLLEALDRRSTSGRIPTVVAVLVAGVLTSSVGALAGARVEPGCDGASKLVDVWDPTRKSDVERAFVETGAPFAQGSWERLERILDRYSDELAGHHAEACRAHASGELSGQTLDLRVACHDDRLRQLRSLVDVLATADAAAAEAAVTAAASLSSVASCLDVDRLADQAAPPARAIAREVASVREELARARALERAKRFQSASEIGQREAIRAERLGYRPLIAEALAVSGSASFRTGDYARAERELSQAYWTATGSNHDAIAAEAATRLIDTLGWAQARFDDALTWGRHADAAIARAELGPVAQTRLLDSFASALDQQGRFAEAREAAERMVALTTASVDLNDPRVALATARLGLIVEHQGEVSFAAELFGRALQIQLVAFGQDHPHVGDTLTKLGAAKGKLGDNESARQHFERALSIQAATLGPDHPRAANTRGDLAIAHRRLGNLTRALSEAMRALRALERTFGPWHFRVGSVVQTIGAIYRRRGDAATAKRYAWRALSIYVRSLGPDHPSTLNAYNNLAVVYDHERRYDEARVLYERVLAGKSRVYGPDHADLAALLGNLAAAAWAEKDAKQAWDLLARAEYISERSPDTSVRDLPRISLLKGWASWRLERRGEAIASFERGLRVASVENDARFLGLLQYSLGSALWDTNRDRTRAIELCESARDVLRRAQSPDLATVEAWLANHAN